MAGPGIVPAIPPSKTGSRALPTDERAAQIGEALVIPGFVYVLINPSLEGLLKVGYSERDPEERAKELSRATGVPTPFVVAYYECFSDAVKAEQYIHAVLGQRGYRLTESREFFRAPLKVVVDAIREAAATLQPPAAKADDLDTEAIQSRPPANLRPLPAWWTPFVEGIILLRGEGQGITDELAAEAKFRRAVQLKSRISFYALARHFSTPGSQDARRAIRFAQESMRAEEPYSYAAASLAYMTAGEAYLAVMETKPTEAATQAAKSNLAEAVKHAGNMCHNHGALLSAAEEFACLLECLNDQGKATAAGMGDSSGESNAAQVLAAAHDFSAYVFGAKVVMEFIPQAVIDEMSARLADVSARMDRLSKTRTSFLSRFFGS